MRPRHWLVLALCLALVIGVLARWPWTVGPLLGTFNRAFRMPAITSAPFVEALSSDAQGALRQRQRLIETWHGNGSYGLHRVQGSVEGTPIGLWLIVQAGTITLVSDYSRDAYSRRGIYVQHPARLEFGAEREREQHPLRSWFPGATDEYVRCVLASNEVAFF